ncbi:MAG: AMP-binding protein [Nitrospiraceae bacterium]
MDEAPLIGPYKPDEVLAWEDGLPVTARRFLSDVALLAAILPERPAVLNLATSRYWFLVGFAAAMIREQVTLLPQSRAPKTLTTIADDYPGSYCLTDGPESVEGLVVCRVPTNEKIGSEIIPIPHIPMDRSVAVAFTSGTTGQPSPHIKTWGALVTVAHATGIRLGVKVGDRKTIVATVPHQHMFGLEASVMLPLYHGFALHAGRPLFPQDVRAALAEVPSGRILVTTPVHLRACTAERTALPQTDLILSATAPLSVDLAQKAERLFHAQVYEIYGFAEAGSVAMRRTAAGADWQTLEEISLVQDQDRWAVQAAYLPQPVPIPDVVTVRSPRSFTLQGRTADQVNIAGHRVSLDELNRTLIHIEGVQDGIFFLPDDAQDTVTRLMAVVVAPGKTVQQILGALRTEMAPVFLPRPLYLVEKLPRNETGKITKDSLRELMRQLQHETSHDL